MEGIITSTPGSSRFSIVGSNSSPMRRRSLVLHKNQERREGHNDDEAERLSLVISERSLTTSTPRSPRTARDTMSSSLQKEHFQGCLKLYAENKITKDNAWNLQLIDFMTSMMKKHDSRMENLQTASTMIDASTRIYSFRVDAVHFVVLKMAGGLVKATQSKRGKKDDNEYTQEEGAADANDPPTQAKKKKKKTEATLATNLELINVDVDNIDIIDLFFERLAATKGDIIASDRTFNATFPLCDRTITVISGTDHPFLERIDGNSSGKRNNDDTCMISYKLVPEWTLDNLICTPFHTFSINNWDPDTEDTNDCISNWPDENRLNLSQQALVFDAHAEVEPIPNDDVQNDLFEDEPLGGIESDEEADVGLAACVARVAPAPPVALADMRPAVAADSKLEYSYNAAIVSAWAGPSHWRLKNNRASKPAERTESAAGRQTVEGKRVTRTKRQLDFLGAGLAFDCRAEPCGDYAPAPPAKIMISRKTLATGHTWNEANYKTPIDRGLDESHFRKLYLRPKMLLVRKRDIEASKQPEPEQLVVEEARDYDYSNENDASYCPNNVHDGDDWANEDATAAGDLHEQVKNTEPLGVDDMLEPPTKVAKIFIPYAARAKKIDMKQLKHTTWKLLTENSPPVAEEVAPTTFFASYHRLPSKLSSNLRESLSVPLALLSVLHLANEKGLILKKRDDMTDFEIVGLIKK